MDQPLLDITDLTIRFAGADRDAVRNVSLSVRRGSALAIVGESGSGKSVTALSILKLLSSSVRYPSGRILLTLGDGQSRNLLDCGPREIQQIRGRDIGIVFQEPMTSLNPVFTCGEQVREAILLHTRLDATRAHEQVLELFRKVHLPLPELCYHKYPHQLSGGQKQRVMIAMAISCNPSLLIFDEPTTALDVTVQKEILLLLRELQHQRSMGMIFISHDLGVVADVADEIAVMRNGELLEAGPAEQVLHQPQHPYTRALIACRPSLSAKGNRLPVVSDFIDGIYSQAPPTSEPPIAETRETRSIQNTDLPLLSVRNLQVSYPAQQSLFGNGAKRTVVNEVSFDIFRGEALGLVGESGCGKTSLGRALLRLIPADSGEILFEEQDILKVGGAAVRSLRKKMQMIFQDPFSSLSPRVRVGTAIGEVLQVHSALRRADRRRRVQELLEQVGLPAAFYERYPHELSGGQRQRVVIARALAVDPTFIVCDESVSALDVSVQAQVLNLLNDLRRQFGFTILFISHDLSVIRYFCDRVLVMQAGRIVESGTVDDVYQRPADAYTRKLLDSVPSAL